ncbi:MAG: FixH family protein [Planctomycetota bacterium]
MKAATLWMWTPAALLIATVAFGAWRVQVALDDPHHAAVATPYKDAQDWDQHLAALAARDALGWSSSLVAAAEGGLLLTLADADGTPLTGLAGTASGFHNGYPSQPLAAAWTERGEGVYHLDVAPARPGLWRWKVEASTQGWFEEFRLHRATD